MPAHRTVPLASTRPAHRRGQIVPGDFAPYDPARPLPTERARLEEIFPERVCDWSLPDQGRPAS